MKFVFVFSLIIFSEIAYCQYDTINETINLVQWGYDPLFTKGADLDGDGLLDLIGGASHFGYTSNIGWSKNLGDELFCYPVKLPIEASMVDYEVLDWDSDGDQDILYTNAAGGTSARAGWLENIGNVPLEWVNHPIHNDTYDVSVRLFESDFGDFDGDGDIDIMAYLDQGVTEGIFFYENDPDAEMLPVRIPGTYDFSTEFANPSDVNGDGKPDLIYESGGMLKYLTHNGIGFESPIVIAGIYGNSYYLADVNQDSRSDIITFRFSLGVTLHLSNNTADGYLPGITITSNGGFPFLVTDLDNDGTQDLIYRDEEDKFTYRFGEITGNNYSYSEEYKYDVDFGVSKILCPTDMNQDGYPEVLSQTNVIYNRTLPVLISVFSNDGHAIQHKTLTQENDFDNLYPEASTSGNLSSFLFSGNCELTPCIGLLKPIGYWDTTYYSSEIIGGVLNTDLNFEPDTNYDWTTHFGDLDTDGDTDAIISVKKNGATEYHQAYLVLNDSATTFVAGERATAYDGEAWKWSIVSTASFDYPLVLKEQYYDELEILFNDDNDGIPDRSQTISYSGRYLNVEFADVNEDGHEDILVSLDEENVKYLLFNPSTLEYEEGGEIGPNTSDTWGFGVADVDEDGVVDIVGDGRGGVWYARGLGNNNFATKETLYFPNTNDLSKVEISDWDGDGDLDIFLLRTDIPVYLEKDSISEFIQYRRHDFTNILDDPFEYKYLLHDFNNDGRKDILTHNDIISVYYGLDAIVNAVQETNISGIEKEYDMVLYPNPVKVGNTVTIEISSSDSWLSETSDLELYMYNVEGNIWKKNSLNLSKASFSLSGLIPGVYTVSLVSGQTILLSGKMVIID